MCAAGEPVLIAPGAYTGDGNRDLTLQGHDLTMESEAGADQTVIDCHAGMYDRHFVFVFREGITRATLVKGLTVEK